MGFEVGLAVGFGSGFFVGFGLGFVPLGLSTGDGSLLAPGSTVTTGTFTVGLPHASNLPSIGPGVLEYSALTTPIL